MRSLSIGNGKILHTYCKKAPRRLRCHSFVFLLRLSNAAWDALLGDFDPARIALLRELRSRCRIFLLSNTNPQHRETILRRFSEQIGGDMNALFEQAFYSDLLRCVKPNREIYEKVEKLAGLVPAETLFIDDKEENVAAARECGWRAYRLDPAKETILDLFRA